MTDIRLALEKIIVVGENYWKMVNTKTNFEIKPGQRWQTQYYIAEIISIVDSNDFTDLASAFCKCIMSKHLNVITGVNRVFYCFPFHSKENGTWIYMEGQDKSE